MSLRHIILHYHILKNAGSTLRSILSRNFGPGHSDIESYDPWDTLESEKLLRFIQANSSLMAVSSHHARLPVPHDDFIRFYPVIFFRHPVDRAGSVYSFERRQSEDSRSLGVPVAREQDISGYIRWRLTDGNGAVIRNFHVVNLAGRCKDMRTAIATKEDLEIAKERLALLAFFGIVERFQDSLRGLHDYLSESFGHLDITCEIENKSPDRKETLGERLYEIRSSLGDELYNELTAKNSLDIELYDFAVNLFLKRNGTGLRPQ